MGKVCKSMDGVVYQNDVTKIRNTMKHTYIYIYILYYISKKRCGKSQQSQQPFLDDSHMIHRFKSLRSDPI